MGNGQSTPLQDCLNAVCNGRDECVSYPGNPIYDIAWVKPYNLDIPIEPIAVIRPDNASDVSGIVKCASENGLHVQAKSGGHSYANFGLGGEDGAVMIDLVNMQSFSIDEESWYATIGPGFRLGELDKQLHANGKRAMAHGVCPGVGIGGHATIGGLGPMSRMWGSALDHVVEVEVVTADGSIKRASEKENSDLFWALRGAGASFAVITEFVVRTHPEPGEVVEYSYSFSFGSQKDMAPVFKSWQDLTGDPDMDERFSSLFIAEPLGALITGTFYGTEEEFQASGIPDKLPSGGTINGTVMDWLGHLAHQAEVEALYLSDIPSAFYSKSLAFREEDLLSEESINEAFTFMGDNDPGTLLWFVIFDTEGGALNKVPVEETSYPHRDKLIMYQSYVVGVPGLSNTTRHWVEGLHEKIQKGAPDASTTYAGYVDAELDRATAQKLYWGDNLPKLEQVKRSWDPKDLFHNPQSVDPAKDGEEQV